MVEVERKLKAFNVGIQQVAQVQQAQVAIYEIYGGPHFSMYYVAHLQQVEEVNYLKKNNPYSNTYNPR